MDELIESQPGQEPEALRERAVEQGYLFFRGVVERHEALRLRAEILRLCAEAGWLDPAAPLPDGIAAEGVAHVEPEPEFMEVYDRVQRLERFHAFAHQPGLLRVFDMVFGERTLVHPRNIARIIFPRNEQFTTPAHQDFIHVQGTEETWTAWMPLGDCPRELGGLAVMPGSHRAGVLPTHAAYGAGGRGIDTDALPYAWATTDYRAGDAILFHSLLVHKGLPNTTTDRMRISVDYRYQAPSQPITQGSLQPHYARVSWDEVYAGWQSTEHQYYWRDLPLQIVDWSPKYRE